MSCLPFPPFGTSQPDAGGLETVFNVGLAERAPFFSCSWHAAPLLGSKGVLRVRADGRGRHLLQHDQGTKDRADPTPTLNASFRVKLTPVVCSRNPHLRSSPSLGDKRSRGMFSSPAVNISTSRRCWENPSPEMESVSRRLGTSGRASLQPCPRAHYPSHPLVNQSVNSKTM